MNCLGSQNGDCPRCSISRIDFRAYCRRSHRLMTSATRHAAAHAVGLMVGNVIVHFLGCRPQAAGHRPGRPLQYHIHGVFGHCMRACSCTVNLSTPQLCVRAHTNEGTDRHLCTHVHTCAHQHMTECTRMRTHERAGTHKCARMPCHDACTNRHTSIFRPACFKL